MFREEIAQRLRHQILAGALLRKGAELPPYAGLDIEGEALPSDTARILGGCRSRASVFA
jgi:hypothetical protein